MRMKEFFDKYTNYILLALVLGGIALSSYLWWFQVTDHIVPCSISGCEHVLTSEYSKILGVPMAVYGVFFYIALGYTIVQRMIIKHDLIERIFQLLMGWGIVFSVYLRYLEFAKIGQICAWCWLSVLIIVLMLGVYGVEYKLNKNS